MTQNHPLDSVKTPYFIEHRKNVLSKLRRILAHREVPDIAHDGHLRTRDRLRRASRVLRRAREIILAGQQVANLTSGLSG